MEDITALLERGADYNVLMKCIGQLAQDFPALRVGYMGTSVLGRGIPMLVLGDAGCRRGVLYVAAHHGSEHITSALLMLFVREYLEALRERRHVCGACVTRLFAAYKIYVIPQLNPDGVDIAINGADGVLRESLLSMNGGEHLEHWQANARGVDLNHNYDARFFEYKSLEASLGVSSPCSSRFARTSPESEPESAALASLLRRHRELGICGVLTLHTQGEEIYCAPVGSLGRHAECTARLVSSLTGYRRMTPVGAAAYGGLTDWCVSALGLPSFTLECGRGENPLPQSDMHPIYTGLRELLFSFPLFA